MNINSRWNRFQRYCWKHFASDWRRANHYLRNTERIYSRLIAEAEEKHDSDEVRNLYGEWDAEAEPEKDEVARLLTAYWLRRVTRYHLPEPDDPRFWTDFPSRGKRLSGAGRRTLASIKFGSYSPRVVTLPSADRQSRCTCAAYIAPYASNIGPVPAHFPSGRSSGQPSCFAKCPISLRIPSAKDCRASSHCLAESKEP